MKKHVISLLAILLVLIFTLTSCGDSEYIAELESQIEDLNQEILDKNEENEKLKEELSAKDGELNTLKSNIKQIEDEILALESKDAENLSKIAELETAYNNKVAELEAKIQELLTSGYFCTATFNVNGGDGEIAPQIVGINKTFNQPESPAKNGYEFVGWYVSGEPVDFPYVATTDVEFVAIYKSITYTVTYNANGGKMPENYVTEYDVETSVTLPTPTRDLYFFDGWYEDAKLEGEKVREIKVGEFGNRTFYAKWISTTNGIKYQLANNGTTYTVTGYEGSDTVVVIPDSVEGIPVTSIAYGAFKDKQRITSITVPDSVTEIGGSAFSGCISLTELNLGNGIKTIPSDMAYGCNKLQSIVIPDSVACIGDWAFGNCYSLESVVIGDSVTSIGGSAFFYCKSLASVIIPDSVTSIGGSAFYDCDSLVSVVIGDSVTSIGYRAFYNCSRLVSVTIPDSVTSIGGSSFFYCKSLASVTIPDSVTSIGGDAFYDCYSLTDVYITNLSNWCNIAFSDSYSNPLYYADNLYLNGELVTNLVIPDDVTQIKSCAFYDCDSLVSVTIPDSVTSIGSSAFEGCYSLVSVVIPDSVTSIGFGAFSRCYRLYVVYNNSDLFIEIGSTINGHVAYNAKLVVDHGKITYVNDEYNYTLTNDGFLFREKDSKYELIAYIGSEDTVTLPENINGNSYDLYYMRGVVNVIIPESFTTINDYAFEGCSSLESVVIGDSITSIGSEAFRGCSSLAVVYYSGSAAEWNRISISSYNDYLENATRYYYSEIHPIEEGNFWHWVDGEVKIWE